MSRFAVILVHSTSHAVRAERLLKRAGLSVRLIPTPRRLSSDCGSAVRIELSDRARVERLLAEAGLEVDRIEPLPE